MLESQRQVLPDWQHKLQWSIPTRVKWLEGDVQVAERPVSGDAALRDAKLLIYHVHGLSTLAVSTHTLPGCTERSCELCWGPEGDDWALEASLLLPTAIFPSSLLWLTSTTPKALVAREGLHASYYYQYTLNKTTRWLDGNVEKCAGVGSVTTRERCEGVDSKNYFFLWPQLMRHMVTRLPYWCFEWTKLYLVQYDVGVAYSGTTFILSLPKIDQLTQHFKRTHTDSHAHRQCSDPMSPPYSLRMESRLNTEEVKVKIKLSL
jgi:hypothetical protein